jgi:hypothetical protein
VGFGADGSKRAMELAFQVKSKSNRKFQINNPSKALGGFRQVFFIRKKTNHLKILMIF